MAKQRDMPFSAPQWLSKNWTLLSMDGRVAGLLAAMKVRRG